MDLSELIPLEKIFFIEKKYGDKLEILEELLDLNLDNTQAVKYREQIWKTLLEREMSISTGIGLGVAIPHCSTPYVKDVQALLALVKGGINFQSVDDEPVQIIILLLLPKNKFEKHIKTLAHIARSFNEEAFRKKLLQVKSKEEAFKVISEP